jgi:hypothetical protein
LERVGVRRIKSIDYIPLIPAFSFMPFRVRREKEVFEFLEVPISLF